MTRMNVDELHKIANERILKNARETDKAFEGKTIANDYFPSPSSEDIVPDVSEEERNLAIEVEAKIKSNAKHSDQELVGDIDSSTQG